MARNLSPELLRRIYALSTCRGRWIVDCRALEGAWSYALRGLDDASFWPTESGASWAAVEPDGSPYKRGTPERAAAYCAATGWQSRLLWCAELLNDDCRWPGGYDAPSIIQSNARIFRDEFAKELVRADGDADGLSLDLRFITPDMLETLEALELYPLISEDDHSELELERQHEAWDSWASKDWRDAVIKALDAHAPEDSNVYWAEELLDSLGDIDERLWELFEACRESANEYWQEESDGCQWIRIDRIAEKIDIGDLKDLTGLPLLAEQQQWRREPYPWLGAEPSPLVAPLPSEP